jgi:catechol 2,3-dioxygenase-like lactoylglutathione lyase family enzyme
MKIKLMSIYVNDQEKALRFYTETLGFAKRSDITNGQYRWLTVASPEEPDGTELQLARNDDPAARTYQEAMFRQGQPAAIFHTHDLQGVYDRLLKGRVTFTVPLATEAWGSMAVLDDTCGNLVQLTQPASQR